MKFFVVLAFCLAVASATPFPQETNPRNLSVNTFEDSLITNGKTAARGQFPYQVGLALNMGRGEMGWCGGSLISPEWILTAAHCVNGYQSITAYLGSTRGRAGVIRNIHYSNMVVHDGWDMQRVKNDIALLNIVAVPLSSDIQIVKLPARGVTNRYVSSLTLISGWGHLSDSAKRNADNLQYARMRVVPNNECNSYYGDIDSNTLCAGTPDHVSPCDGDSGGPLVLEFGDMAGYKVQIGLLSHGSKTGCEKGHPVVFTRLTSYLDWIKEYSGVSS